MTSEFSESRLADRYPLIVFDLDGVVYHGHQAVPHAVETINEIVAGGTQIAFVTNNASRTPAAVAEQLRELGVHAASDDVVTSGQAAAALALQEFGEGARIAWLGGEGLRSAIEDAGLVPVTPHDEAVAIITGTAPEVPWRDISRAAMRVHEGWPWIAPNHDQTYPSAKGIAPGTGAVVDLIARFSGRMPRFAGKPATPLFEATLARHGNPAALMVGDRPDSDIRGAQASGLDSLLVLTGVTSAAAVAGLTAEERPSFVARDLRGLLQVPQTWDAFVGDGSLSA